MIVSEISPKDHYRPEFGYPPLPALTADGCYNPVELVAYFKQAVDQGLRVDQIARHLKVPQHSVTYMLNGGLRNVRRRARASI